MKQYLLIFSVIVLLGGVLLVKVGKDKDPSNPLGYGQITPTITTGSFTCGGAVSQATTSVWAAGTNYQRVILTNIGSGNVHLAWGTNNASTTSGHFLSPAGSSTAITSRDVTDANLLGKAANCVASTTSTVQFIAY